MSDQRPQLLQDEHRPCAVPDTCNLHSAQGARRAAPHGQARARGRLQPLQRQVGGWARGGAVLANSHPGSTDFVDTPPRARHCASEAGRGRQGIA